MFIAVTHVRCTVNVAVVMRASDGNGDSIAFAAMSRLSHHICILRLRLTESSGMDAEFYILVRITRVEAVLYLLSTGEHLFMFPYPLWL